MKNKQTKNMETKVYESIEDYLNSKGEKGSTKRLEIISLMNLGARSDAARRVCEKRYRRKELMDMGLSFEDAVLKVNKTKYHECIFG